MSVAEVLPSAVDQPAANGPTGTTRAGMEAPSETQRPVVTSLDHLVRIEGGLRACRCLEQLASHLANETVALLPFSESLVFKLERGWQMQAASGRATVQRDASQVRWFERLVSRVWQQTGRQLEPIAFEVSRYADPDDALTREQAQRQLLWIPLADAERSVGLGWLLCRTSPWEPHHLVLAERLAAAYAHGAHAIHGRRRRWQPLKGRAVWVGAATASALAAAMALVQVPLITRAPVEVVAASPFVVAAPMEAVVDRILVAPGTEVAVGTPLVQLNDIEWRNKYEVAQRQLEVAEARTLRLRQASITDNDARRELAIAQSEQRVAEAERNYAQAMLDKTLIRARTSGVALYSDPRDWVGRPVAVGEALMQVADPADVEFRIEVPAADAVNLLPDARVDVFLDAAPLDPIEAHLERASYKAEANAAGIANFTVAAEAEMPDGEVPRMGLRGVARIHGDQVSLFYYLFRRPLVALRQLTGV